MAHVSLLSPLLMCLLTPDPLASPYWRWTVPSLHALITFCERISFWGRASLTQYMWGSYHVYTNVFLKASIFVQMVSINHAVIICANVFLAQLWTFGGEMKAFLIQNRYLCWMLGCNHCSACSLHLWRGADLMLGGASWWKPSERNWEAGGAIFVSWSANHTLRQIWAVTPPPIQTKKRHSHSV